MMTTATARSSQLVLSSVFWGALAFGAASSASAQTAPRPSVFQTTLEKTNQPTPEITTEELQKILASNSAPVFDVRTAKEYAVRARNDQHL